MDRLHLMLVFVAVAEEQSFARAARRLALSPPAVTRAVAALESRLGVKLLTRTTRLVRITEAGQRYLDDSRRILAELDEADEAVVGAHSEPRGLLAVTAPALFGRMFVTPGIVEYLRRYPKVRVAALLVDRVVNLLEEGLDAGVRIGPLPDSSMHATGVGFVRHVVCAAPGYFEQNAAPVAPADLMSHAVIATGGANQPVDWRFAGTGKPVTVRLEPRLTLSSNDAAIEAALRGAGVTRLLSYQVAPEVAAGRLKIVLADFEPERLPIHVVHREGRHASAKVRRFVDLMVARLRSDQALH